METEACPEKTISWSKTRTVTTFTFFFRARIPELEFQLEKASKIFARGGWP
jgi:hypothetical protein